MDWLTFFSKVLQAVAWPVAVVACVAILRSEIASLIRRVRKIRHKESEIDLSEGVAAAKQEASRFQGFGEERTDSEARLIRLAEESPRGAILDAWLGVEEAMESYAQRYGLDSARTNAQRIEQIEMHDLDGPHIGKGVTEMLRRLRQLRNNAVHRTDMEVTESVAIDYVSLAERVKRKLEEA